MADWFDEPPRVLGKDPSLLMAAAREDHKGGQPYIANGCMRSLRASYHHARKTVTWLWLAVIVPP